MQAAPSHTQTVLVCLLVVAIAGGLVAWILSTEPTAIRKPSAKQSAMLVDVIPVHGGPARPEFIATGTVQAELDIELRAQVGGEILTVADAFVPGGFVAKGQVLLQIQPADYRNALAQRHSELATIQAELDIEMGRQRVARKEYELFTGKREAAQQALVLREPQLQVVKSAITAATARVAQAELDLERTTVRAPFAGQLLERHVNQGSQVEPGTILGRFVGIDQYWVIASMPLSTLQYIEQPLSDSTTTTAVHPEVRLRNRSAWAQGVYRTGHLTQLVGLLDTQTRMARLLITVQDPLAHHTQAPPLLIGEFVEARIRGQVIPGAVAINREYLRSGPSVWLAKDGRLQVVPVTVATQDAEHAFITAGLQAGDQLITTNLASVLNGAKIRIKKTAQTDDNGEGRKP